MLINGDLVRIPQGTVIIDIANDPIPLQVATHPKVGIVIDNKTKHDELIKVLLDEEVFYVDKRVLQLLVGDK